MTPERPTTPDTNPTTTGHPVPPVPDTDLGASDGHSVTEDLARFIDGSPTPWHAVRQVAERLEAAGFRPDRHDGPGFTEAGGTIIAWGRPDPTRPLRLIGAHTDSPGLRVRPRPESSVAGWERLGVEVYGGALWNSWLDRDLAAAGRVIVMDEAGPRPVLFRSEGPVARIPQVAIHLDRGVNESLSLNPQTDLQPVWGLSDPGAGHAADWLGQISDWAGVDPAQVLGWEAALVDAAPPARLGRHRELLAAPRLDNLASCHAALLALLAHPDAPVVIALFDHEEVGSTSAGGADSNLLAAVLAELGLTRPAAGSMFLSADMAHATHPNRPHLHEPNHPIVPGAGPAIKHNANQRYATDALGAAAFRAACRAAGVPTQEYSHRGDLPCGSTIGPIVAARLAMPTVDVGGPMLSMHSARELMAVADVDLTVRAFTAWFAATG